MNINAVKAAANLFAIRALVQTQTLRFVARSSRRSVPRPVPPWSTFTQLVLRLSLTYAHAGERHAARISPKGRMGLQQKQKMATTQQARWAWLRPPWPPPPH
eukprot:scaffold31705_cov46-Phaeocystis_antarctica.AAC.1